MSGRIILVGDDIDTDQLAPGAYMKGGIEALAAHCLEGVRPGFAQEVTPGDVLVAGRNFGVGSSREQAAEALKHLGLAGEQDKELGAQVALADDCVALVEAPVGARIGEREALGQAQVLQQRRGAE